MASYAIAFGPEQPPTAVPTRIGTDRETPDEIACKHRELILSDGTDSSARVLVQVPSEGPLKIAACGWGLCPDDGETATPGREEAAEKHRSSGPIGEGRQDLALSPAIRPMDGRPKTQRWNESDCNQSTDRPDWVLASEVPASIVSLPIGRDGGGPTDLGESDRQNAD